MQDLYNALVIFLFFRNNELTVYSSQTSFAMSSMMSFFPIDVYPAVFFLILFLVFACHEKMFSSLVERICISIFEFSVAKGSVTWKGSKGSRTSE